MQSDWLKLGSHVNFNSQSECLISALVYLVLLTIQLELVSSTLMSTFICNETRSQVKNTQGALTPCVERYKSTAPGADVINKFFGSIAMQHWNKAIWLVRNNHVTWNSQSECFISLKFAYDIGSWPPPVCLVQIQ